MTNETPEALEEDPTVHDLDTGVDIDNDPETDIAESLQSALKSLRSDADSLESMPLADARVAAAEQIADAAASLDEQIGQIARSDDD